MAVRSIVRRTMEFLRSRRRAYCQTFLSGTGQIVLNDLIKFCRANETCFDPDPRIHAVLEGRREVFLRIQQHLNLTPEQLFTLYNGGAIYNPQEEQDEVAA